MSCYFELLVNIVDEVYRYRHQKTVHECSLAIHQKNQELSLQSYTNSAKIQRNNTVDLHKCRFKLANLKKQIDINEPLYGELFDGLLKDLEKKISDVENKRRIIHHK